MINAEGKYESSLQNLLNGDNQARVAAWILETFGIEFLRNGHERTLRLIEEVVELAQAAGIEKDVVHRVIDYVFSRPVGTVEQEIAGSMVTLYGAATAFGVDAQGELEKELTRINTPEVKDRCRRRQDEKREALVGQ